MTESKKTEPVDNFPYLVYTDEAGRTYDGNGGGGSTRKVPVYIINQIVSEGVYAVDFVSCMKINKYDDYEAIDLSSFETAVDAENGEITKIELDAGTEVCVECAVNSLADIEYSPIVVGNDALKLSGAAFAEPLSDTDVGIFFTIPDYDYTDAEEMTAFSIAAADVPFFNIPIEE